MFPRKPTISQSTATIFNNHLQNKPNTVKSKPEGLNLYRQENYDNNTENMNKQPNQNTGDANILHQNEADTDTNIEETTKIYTPTSKKDNMTTLSEKEQMNDKRNDNAEISNAKNEKSTNIQNSRTAGDERNSLLPTRMPTSFTSTVNENHIGSSNNEVDETTESDALKQGETPEPQEASKESAGDEDDQNSDKNADNSRISNVPTRLLSKPNISKTLEDEKVKKENIENAGNIKNDHSGQLPTSGPTKRHGLGLQESLGMLEPAESNLKVCYLV